MTLSRSTIRWTPILLVLALVACPGAQRGAGGMSESGGEASDTTGQATGEGAMANEIAGAPSGIVGTVTIGPSCPAQEIGRECPAQPYEATLLVKDAASGAVLHQVRSDSTGHFRLALPPGSYMVEPPERQLVGEPEAEPVPVTVEVDGWVEVRIAFDSGAR